MQKTVFENTLYRILKISAPVGMSSESFSGIPSWVALSFSFLFQDFGADQCASSEGFSVTFIPGSGVISFDYPFFSEYRLNCSHFFNRKTVYPRSKPSERNLVRLHQEWQYCRMIDEKQSFDAQEIWVRLNLMMTAPSGVLVALIPTDEGRIGTGRNTKKQKKDESEPHPV